MTWKLRHQGSPRSIDGLNPQRIVEGLQDGQWESTDEVMGPGDADWAPIENHPQFADIVEDLEPPESRHQEDETHLDMTPLIDVTQVLLIFFILTTSYASIQQMIEAASVASDSPGGVRQVSEQQVAETMVVVKVSRSVQGDPVIQVENETVALEDVAGAIKGYRGVAQRTKLLINSDPQVPHGVIIKIQDAAKAAGMDQVLFLVPGREG